MQIQSMSQNTTISSHIHEESLEDIQKFEKLSEIAKIPAELMHPFRLIILSSLYRGNFVSFQQLKIQTGMTDGNLVSHLRALENMGILVIFKTIAGKYPKTFYELTSNGKEQYQNLRNTLKNYINGLEVE